VNPELTYAVAEVQSVFESESTSGGKQRKVGNILSSEKGKLFVIVASDLVTNLESKWGVKLVVHKSFPGSALEHCRFVFCVGPLSNGCSAFFLNHLYVLISCHAWCLQVCPSCEWQ